MDNLNEPALTGDNGLSNPVHTPSYNDEFIRVRGAHEHNLKNVSVDIPRNTLTVITGLSGSGKSSLAFDTIFAEGQRRYVESLSTYARQFLPVLERPNVESVDGLSPTIAIQQKTTSHNPRSTVGTVTEIYDYLRLLYARVSTAYCAKCNKPIESQTTQNIAERILALRPGSRLHITAPFVRARKGEYQKEMQGFRAKGFALARVDGKIRDLSEEIILDKQKKHSIDVIIDRLILRPDTSDKQSLQFRIYESVETAARLADGLVKVEILDRPQPQDQSPVLEELLFSTKYACPDCGSSYPEPEPRTFSFNSPMGACSKCDGLGVVKDTRSKGAVDDEDEETTTCPKCLGKRLRPESLVFQISNVNIAQATSLACTEALAFFKQVKFTERQRAIIDRVLKEVVDRLQFLVDVGVGYLTLDRSAKTLSGGESQRIRLATQIGSSLTGVVYVLDEPSIGLHQRDHQRLLKSLLRLRDIGNTVLVVEHDRDTMMAANHIVDLGPGAGIHGGAIVAQGDSQSLIDAENSLTGKYLSGELEIPTPKVRRKNSVMANPGMLTLTGATGNNLKDVTLNIPLGLFVCITGVSGSGKSTLIVDTLVPALKKALAKPKDEALQRLSPSPFKSIEGLSFLDKIIEIDQSPIGRTPRSNPATYTGIFDEIRTFFALLPESRVRGFKPGRFSFNVKGGRCEGCQGGGLARVEMHFLSDVYVTCSTCGGKRYNEDTLFMRYKGKNISQVLNLTIEEAAAFFENIPTLKNKLSLLNDVGLGYLTLGQSATTLSGGEAQRLKLATELARRSTGKTIYVLDEPSTGLHFEDIRKLLTLLNRLVDQGNTVIVIEHNLDIVKCADHIIDLGPEGGEAGGQIIGEGTPEQLMKNKSSITGQVLKASLN